MLCTAHTCRPSPGEVCYHIITAMRAKAHFLERKVRPPGAWNIHSLRPLGLTCFTLLQPCPSSGTGSGLRKFMHLQSIQPSAGLPAVECQRVQACMQSRAS